MQNALFCFFSSYVSTIADLAGYKQARFSRLQANYEHRMKT